MKIARFSTKFCFHKLSLITVLLFSLFSLFHSYRYINVIWFVMHFMAMASASTNPFVYAIYSVCAKFGSCLLTGFTYMNLSARYLQEDTFRKILFQLPLIAFFFFVLST